MIPQSLVHAKQFMVVCDHYFNFASKGMEMPVVLEKPMNKEDSGVIALCFDCMDLAEANKFENIPAGSVCVDCFQENMYQVKEHNKHSKKVVN